VLRYEIRRGSGGAGRFQGGDGIRRDVQLLTVAQVTLLSERRRFPPYGLAGGAPVYVAKISSSKVIKKCFLPGKGSFEFNRGDVLSIARLEGRLWAYRWVVLHNVAALSFHHLPIRTYPRRSHAVVLRHLDPN